MFGEPIPDQNAQHYSNEDALAKLIVRKIDVAIIVAGQPAKLFQDMNPELLQQIKLLRLDPSAPETVRAKQTYFPAIIRTTSYPNWIQEEVADADRQGISRHLRLRAEGYGRHADEVRRFAVHELRQSAGATVIRSGSRFTSNCRRSDAAGDTIRRWRSACGHASRDATPPPTPRRNPCAPRGRRMRRNSRCASRRVPRRKRC